jgi:type IV pilus assembly protein PilW
MNKRAQHGFGLVELMVAITLGLLLTAAMIQMVLAARQSYTVSDSMSRIQDSGRFGVDLIAQDLRRAGYLGMNNKLRDDGGDLLVGGTLGPATIASSCATNDSTWGRMIGRPVFGLNDSNAGYACIPNDDYLRGDILVSRYAIADPVGIEGVAYSGKSYADNQAYLRSGMMEGKIFLGSDKANADNDLVETPSADHALRAFAYYVGNTSRSCQGQVIPALYRETLDANGQPMAEELIPGAENLQFKYGVSGQYFDADGVTDWSAVNSVRLWLLVRAECPETGFEDHNSYALGDVAFVPNTTTVEGRYRRRLYSSVVSIRNRL